MICMLIYVVRRPIDKLPRFGGGRTASSVYLTFIIFFAVQNLVSLVAISNLLIFHVWLKFKGISTYQYVRGERDSTVMPSSRNRVDLNEAHAKDHSQVKRKFTISCFLIFLI